MDKRILASIILFVVFGSIYFLLLNNQNNTSSYYDELSQKCSGDNCCLNSVKRMESKKAIVSSNGECPDGYKADMLRCISSYKWCEPLKK